MNGVIDYVLQIMKLMNVIMNGDCDECTQQCASSVNGSVDLDRK